MTNIRENLDHEWLSFSKEIINSEFVEEEEFERQKKCSSWWRETARTKPQRNESLRHSGLCDMAEHPVLKGQSGIATMNAGLRVWILFYR